MPLKPVVFIPGFPASELVRSANGKRVFPPDWERLLTAGRREALVAELTRPDSPPRRLIAGQPIRRVLPVAKQAESLYDILRMRHGYTIDRGDNFRSVGWDWRLAIDDPDVQQSVRDAITELADRNGRKVVVIVHSTGGLVFRRLLEDDPPLAGRIEQILAFGVPWAGTLKAFFYLTRGEAIGIPGFRLTAAQTREVMRSAQAAYDLCPPDPFRTDLTDAAGRALRFVTDVDGADVAPLTSTQWLPAGAAESHARARSADDRLGHRTNRIALQNHPVPPILNIGGWGVETEVRCTLGATGKVTFNPSDLEPGEAKEGDGTVALKSVAWLRGEEVRTLFLPIGAYPMDGIPNPHPRIWDSPPLEDVFRAVLNDAEPRPWVWAAADGDEALDRRSAVTIRLVATDADGRPLPAAVATVRLPGKNKVVDLRGSPRASIVVKRGSMKANAAPDLFRFTIDVEWSGDGKELPVLVRV